MNEEAEKGGGGEGSVTEQVDILLPRNNSLLAENYCNTSTYGSLHQMLFRNQNNTCFAMELFNNYCFDTMLEIVHK